MRLSFKEKSAITSGIRLLFPEIELKIYLFGSRIDDSKKGGDIDLLLVTLKESKNLLVDSKSKIKLQIYKNIPEQKIDITVATVDEIREDVFLKSIMPEAVLLD